MTMNIWHKTNVKKEEDISGFWKNKKQTHTSLNIIVGNYLNLDGVMQSEEEMKRCLIEEKNRTKLILTNNTKLQEEKEKFKNR